LASGQRQHRDHHFLARRILQRRERPADFHFDQFKANTEKLAKYCAANPSDGLITAADKTLVK